MFTCHLPLLCVCSSLLKLINWCSVFNYLFVLNIVRSKKFVTKSNNNKPPKKIPQTHLSNKWYMLALSLRKGLFHTHLPTNSKYPIVPNASHTITHTLKGNKNKTHVKVGNQWVQNNKNGKRCKINKETKGNYGNKGTKSHIQILIQ